MFFIQQNEDVIPRDLLAKGVTVPGEILACDVVFTLLTISTSEQNEWLSSADRELELD